MYCAISEWHVTDQQAGLMCMARYYVICLIALVVKSKFSVVRFCEPRRIKLEVIPDRIVQT